MKYALPVKINVDRSEVTLTVVLYGNGRIAIKGIVMSSMEDIAGTFPEPYGILTVNLPDVKLPPRTFCIKDWSENEAFAKAAFETGMFIDTRIKLETGFVYAPLWKFTPEIEKLVESWKVVK